MRFLRKYVVDVSPSNVISCNVTVCETTKEEYSTYVVVRRGTLFLNGVTSYVVFYAKKPCIDPGTESDVKPLEVLYGRSDAVVTYWVGSYVVTFKDGALKARIYKL